MDLTVSSNKFALDLYRGLRNTSDNVIVSPISVQLVLAMAQQGAKGQTSAEITKVLHLPEDNLQVLKGHKSLIQALQSPVLKAASRLFVEKSFKLYPEFQNALSTYFLSEATGEDFISNHENARQDINGWVSKNTNDKIKDLLPQGSISSDTRLVLVNAIHFKAMWKKQFIANDTREMPFYVTPTDTVNVPMMVQLGAKYRFKSSPQLDADILEVPYANNEFSMIIILPKKVDGLSYVEDNLSNLDLSEELAGLVEQPVDLYLPKFKLEQTIELNEILKQLGMPTAFTGRADFSGIANETVTISTAIQKAFIEVNEEGTEAAAATAAGVRVKRAIVEKPTKILCDHPFGFLIIHASTGAVLFESRLKNIPQWSSGTVPGSVHEEL